MGLETSEHTDGRVHFTGLIETVSDVPGYIWGPLARNPDFRSGRETTKSMVRQPKLLGDLCGRTLSRPGWEEKAPQARKFKKNTMVFDDFRQMFVDFETNLPPT